MRKILAILLTAFLLATMIPLGAVSVSAASFSPRLTAPSKTGYYGIQSSMNPFRVNTSAGGGNCTWYAWGRAYEILGSRPKLSTGNACTWYPNNQSNGNYPYGSEPKLGAIICWSGGSSGAGHVAVVEQIHSNGTITISESSWSATSWWFRTKTLSKYGDYGGSLTFQGYIYILDGALNSHQVDSSYGKNFTAYPKAKITAENIFDASHNMISSTAWIGKADKCTIHEVYTDGCCKVSYPLDEGGTETVYSKIALFDVAHTCNKGQYMYYEAAHPHYLCYKCSICGEVWRNTAETQILSNCLSCTLPGKPSLIGLKSDYYDNENIVFKWNATKNTTHYNVWLGVKNAKGEWIRYDHLTYATSGLSIKLPIGEYRCVIQAYNSKYFWEDGSDWQYTESDFYYFNVKCNHIYDNACDTTCNTCGATRSIKHSYSAATCTKPKTCSVCGVTSGSALGHKYDNACDATCNTCGDKRSVKPHDCEITVLIAATCGEDGINALICKHCKYEDTIVVPATGKHTYDNACDKDCNTCGATRSIKHSYSAATCTKPETCTVCGHTQGTALGHKYDDDYDATCNVCGDVREVPEKPVDPSVPDLPADAPAFVVENATARAGEEFTVAIRTQRNSGIVSLKLNVGYDADVLELVSIKEQDFAGMSFGPLSNNPIAVNWVDTLHPDNTTNGVVALLTFRVKKSASMGETAISITYDAEDVYDQNYANVAFRVENGVVEIVDFAHGDVNGDGKINNKDLGLLQQYLNDWDVMVVAKAADANGDGKVNNKDLGLLQQYLNDWDVQLG